MTYELDAEGVGRLEAYFEGIGTRLGEKRRRASFPLYAMGILGEHERKSVEPLAAAAANDPEDAQRTHDHLLHFIGQSEWEDGPIRGSQRDTPCGRHAAVPARVVDERPRSVR
jgi:SRSO17 transposase